MRISDWSSDVCSSDLWPFQYNNAHYPDVDDSAVVVMAMDRAGSAVSKPAMERAAKWIIAMQSRNGGWGAFDADNAFRSEERRVGKACVSPCRFRGAPCH